MCPNFNECIDGTSSNKGSGDQSEKGEKFMSCFHKYIPLIICI